MIYNKTTLIILNVSYGDFIMWLSPMWPIMEDLISWKLIHLKILEYYCFGGQRVILWFLNYAMLT